MDAISAAGVGKRYTLGRESVGSRNIREVATNALRHLPRRIRTHGKRPKGPEFWALQDVSFDVPQGEILGVIGRNGAGKSTLLKVLSEITEPTTGRIELRGRVASLLEVGTGFHPELSGRENVYLNGAVLGMSKVEVQSKFDEIVEFAGVSRFIDTPVKRYSSGMYLRLAFAVAAHLESEILLVDEVLAVGDAEFQKKCLGKLGEVTQEGRTVLFVSHNLNAIERLCTRVLHLRDGTIAEVGVDVSAVVNRYLEGTIRSAGSTLWVNQSDAAAGNVFIPRSFSIGDDDGRPFIGPVSNKDTMWFYMSFDILTTDAAFALGYAIYDEDDVLLYWTFPTDSPEVEWPLLDEGRHTLRSRIPSRFLNEGVYRVEWVANLYFREWLLEPRVNAPSITFSIRGGLSDSPYWTAKRTGVLAPVMKWEHV